MLAVSAPAYADGGERLEASGFFGMEDFSDHIGLGNALAPEQRPRTAPTFGGRLTYFPLRTGGDIHLDFGPELELSFTPSWTGSDAAEMRSSYFAPVFGYRANLLLRLGGTWFQPHISGGAGAMTVTSSSPQTAKETDPIFAWGLGAVVDVGGLWQLRLDGRQVLAESNQCTQDSCRTASNYELLLAVGVRFGKKPVKKISAPPLEHVEVAHTTQPDPDHDADEDGIPDRLDACPARAESKNGIEDDDGCPELDPDGDGYVGNTDKCPDRPEDFDKFQDDDGCPEDDNDKDGIADAKDKCPNDAEIVNNIVDDDGCPDSVAPGVLESLASASKAKFDPNSVRISSRIKDAVDKALLAMLSNGKLKFVITVHPEAAGDKDASLAKKRAENLKGYFNEQGVAMASLITTVGPVATDKQAPTVVLTIAP